MQFRSIIRIVGLLLALFSVTMLAPALVALIYRDGAGVPFVTTFFVLLFCGTVCWFPNRRHKHELKARDGFLIVVLFWTVLGSAGALPFLIADNPSISITDAFFESFSALTTTGATVIVGLDETAQSDFILSPDTAMVWRYGNHRAGGRDFACSRHRWHAVVSC